MHGHSTEPNFRTHRKRTKIGLRSEWSILKCEDRYTSITKTKIIIIILGPRPGVRDMTPLVCTLSRKNIYIGLETLNMFSINFTTKQVINLLELTGMFQ